MRNGLTEKKIKPNTVTIDEAQIVIRYNFIMKQRFELHLYKLN